MNEKYREASPVEVGVLNLIGKALDVQDKRNDFIKSRSYKTMIGHGVKIGAFDSGTVSLKPVEYKGQVCFLVECNLYDYSLYDVSYPYAKGLSAAYLLDQDGHLLAIAENQTRPEDLDSFPWSVAHSKCKDKTVKDLLDDPAIFVKSAGQAISPRKPKKKPSNIIEYIRSKKAKQVVTTSIQVDLSVKDSTKDFVRAITDRPVSRNLHFIDRSIQDNVDSMEALIDRVLESTTARVPFRF